MAERKAWTRQEDQTLKTLYEEHRMSKWSEIAKAMKSHGMPGRNGKQCRQRYHNHLDSSIRREEWNQQQVNELVTLHNSIGNRWAQISRALPGRSQNCVKNKVYSILRRGLKCINSAIKTKLKRYKQLQISIVYKVVQACEDTHKKKTLTKQMVETLDIKKQIIYYGVHHYSPEDIPNIKTLIDKIKNFSKGVAAIKQPVKTEKQEDVSIPSEEIQSSEFRDNITDLKGKKKTSLHHLALEPLEPEEPPQTKPCLFTSLSKMIKNSSRESNKEMDMHEPRFYDLLPGGESLKSFEFPDYDQNMRSPKPVLLGESPYFDELRMRSSFNSWSQFLPQ